jgi:simple sugar transport system permease protein
LVLVLFLLPLFVFLLLSRTKLGLHIKAVGENPKAAEVAGVSVSRTRVIATSLGGALLGMAGAYLTVDLFNQFTPGITGGLGFIALAAVIAGAWSPAYVLGVAGVFGLTEGLTYVVGATSGAETYLLSMPPYVITIAVMAIASKRLRPPAALAQPYKKE